MNTNTGEILEMDEIYKNYKDALTLEKWKEIPSDTLLTRLEGMNRHDRRKYYATHKEEFKDVIQPKR